ncbi:MAG TPA: hypothetical protein VM734_24005 [Kofleriaceae bacterium]|nr:hypothetical protein [Kofleriaceae bacterium]
MTTDDDPPPPDHQVEAFLSTLRRSVEVVQDLMAETARQHEQIRSLGAELESARQRIAFLEAETTTLRERLASGIGQARFAELEELIEEQSSLAHMFVTSDRLARARTPGEAIDIAVEVLHNLVGAHTYALWLRWEGAPALLAPADARWRASTEAGRALVERAFATGLTVRAPGRPVGGVPVAMPLALDGRTIGVLHIATLVPQLGERMGRLQEDLIQFVIDRLPVALLAAAMHQGHTGPAAWAAVRTQLTAIEEGSP